MPRDNSGWSPLAGLEHLPKEISACFLASWLTLGHETASEALAAFQGRKGEDINRAFKVKIKTAWLQFSENKKSLKNIVSPQIALFFRSLSLPLFYFQ